MSGFLDSIGLNYLWNKFKTYANQHFIPGENIIIKNNIQVPVSLWAEDSTYVEYGYKYRAAVPINDLSEGVTLSNYKPNITYGPVEMTNKNHFGLNDTYDAGFYMWAIEIPEGTITIPTAEFIKAVN